MTENNDNTRRYFSASEKVHILKLHLLDRQPVSEICQKFDLQPTVFYRWQTQFFENGEKAFAVEKSVGKPLRKRLEQMEAKLAAKNEVVSEGGASQVKLPLLGSSETALGRAGYKR